MLFIPDGANSASMIRDGLIANPIPEKQTIENPAPPPSPTTPTSEEQKRKEDEDSELKALDESQLCASTLILMDFCRFFIGLIGLIVRHHEIGGILLWYVIIATALDAGGWGFNIFIRWPTIVARLVKWGCCAKTTSCCRTGAPAIAKRELAINLWSMPPTIAMFIFGAMAFHTSYMVENVPATSMAVYGWITALIYAIKAIIGFPYFIGRITNKFRLLKHE